ncbi:MAG TPA: methyltransferase domain-containing protein [Roseiflexaceae bacterium]|nr:methyltransferase domain-containing protein [Roseiflexaceae bacterium]
MRRNQTIYIAHTQPGFEAIVAQQIAAEEGAEVRGTRVVSDKNGMVLFTYEGDPRELLELRTVEDVFVLVRNIPEIPPIYAGLRVLRDAVQQAQLEQAVTLARQIRPGRGGHGKFRFRVVSRLAANVSYRRVDAQEAVERGITARTDRRWVRSDEHALEFWLTVLPDEVLLALRLSDDQMRHRTEKREHIPASLRPAAAAAMVWLTRPQVHEYFLDPMCGAGTILIERAHAGRYKMLYGGDISPEALAAAQTNVGTRYQPITLQEWDARQLPLDDSSISAGAVNLPFGRQIGTREENRTLYPAVLREVARVLRPASRFVALTGDTRSFERALERTPALVRRDSFPVLVLGLRAVVYVLRKE